MKALCVPTKAQKWQSVRCTAVRYIENYRKCVQRVARDTWYFHL